MRLVVREVSRVVSRKPRYSTYVSERFETRVSLARRPATNPEHANLVHSHPVPNTHSLKNTKRILEKLTSQRRQVAKGLDVCFLQLFGSRLGVVDFDREFEKVDSLRVVETAQVALRGIRWRVFWREPTGHVLSLCVGTLDLSKY